MDELQTAAAQFAQLPTSADDATTQRNVAVLAKWYLQIKKSSGEDRGSAASAMGEGEGCSEVVQSAIIRTCAFKGNQR